MRKLSPEFMEDLQAGILSPILKSVQDDKTLMLFIRKNDSIRIYYKGGVVLELKRRPTLNNYKASNGHGIEKHIVDFPKEVSCKQGSVSWVNKITELKRVKDSGIIKKMDERSYQQDVAYENNISGNSINTDYFITDIEYRHPKAKYTLDMLALKLEFNEENKGKFVPVWIEVKLKKLGSKSGVEKHLKDFEKLLDSQHPKLIYETMESQFKQLVDLGLIKWDASKEIPELDQEEPPEIMLLIRNYSPKSPVLRKRPYVKEFSDKYDMKIFAPKNNELGLYSKKMKTLQQFLKDQ
jgi:hypothetical protein